LSEEETARVSGGDETLHVFAAYVDSQAEPGSESTRFLKVLLSSIVLAHISTIGLGKNATRLGKKLQGKMMSHIFFVQDFLLYSYAVDIVCRQRYHSVTAISQCSAIAGVISREGEDKSLCDKQLYRQ